MSGRIFRHDRAIADIAAAFAIRCTPMLIEGRHIIARQAISRRQAGIAAGAAKHARHLVRHIFRVRIAMPLQLLLYCRHMGIYYASQRTA